MDAKTLTALRGSIAKWEAIVAGTGRDLGIINCPLCQLFYKEHFCIGCPVQVKVNQASCKGTPYIKFVRLARDPKIKSETKLAAAQAELDFLRSLLPKEPENE